MNKDLAGRFHRVYYHANCNDGFSALWAWDTLVGPALDNVTPLFEGTSVPRVSRVYRALAYGDEVAGNLHDATRGNETIWFLDYCPKPETVKALLDSPAKPWIRIIDHHDTALRYAAEFPRDPRLLLDINVEKSGCVLTWEKMRDDFDGAVPPLLEYVQDRDLWKFELPESHELNCRLQNEERSITRWDQLNEIFDGSAGTEAFLEYRSGAMALSAARDLSVEYIVRSSRMITLAGHIVPAANTQYAVSDVGEALCEAEEGADFSVTFYFTGDGNVKFSLRTDHDDCNVALIAQQFGGGGHPRASGFVLTVEEFNKLNLWE